MLRLTTRLAARRRATATRAMSTEYAFDEPTNKSGWPRTKANTVINVVPQGEAHVVERARHPPSPRPGLPGGRDAGFLFQIFQRHYFDQNRSTSAICLHARHSPGRERALKLLPSYLHYQVTTPFPYQYQSKEDQQYYRNQTKDSLNPQASRLGLMMDSGQVRTLAP